MSEHGWVVEVVAITTKDDPKIKWALRDQNRTFLRFDSKIVRFKTLQEVDQWCRLNGVDLVVWPPQTIAGWR